MDSEYNVGDEIIVINGFNKGKKGIIKTVYPDEGAGHPLEIEINNGTTTYDEFDISVIETFQIKISKYSMIELKKLLVEQGMDDDLDDAKYINEAFNIEDDRGDGVDFREDIEVNKCYKNQI